MLTEEQRQYLAVFCVMRMINVSIGIYLSSWMVFFTRYYYVVFLYFVWYCYSFYLVHFGGMRIKRLRKMKWLKYFRDYYPMHLIKTAPLDPNKNYMMGSHPHGIFGAGAFFNFNTDVTGFDKLYPGITPTTISLDSIFLLPVIRELIMVFGNCSSTRKSIEHIFTKQGKGNLAIILIGGMDEVALSKPDEMLLVLRKRRGFVKIAINCGADLLPSLTFGENGMMRKRLPDIFKFSWFNKIENLSKKYFKVQVNIVATANVFLNSMLTITPPRMPVFSVVGRPIEVVQDPDPSEETVNLYLDKYIESIEQLFEEYKVKLGDTFKNCKLKIV